MRIYRSRIVVPIDLPPIEDGAVGIEAGHIAEVGRFSDLKKKATAGVCDLGSSILLPGLINCHCHLDYTKMAGKIARKRHFVDWLKGMIEMKKSWSRADFAHSWRLGARMLESTGTTSLVDIEALPDLLPEMWKSTSMRLWSCLELIDLHSSKKACKLVSEMISQSRRIEKNQKKSIKQCGLSPHSIYSTSDDLRRSAAEIAQYDHRLLTTHIAESKEEWAFFFHHRGPLFDWLKSQRSFASFPKLFPKGSPISILEKTGYLRSLNLAVHVNELGKGDEDRLAKHGVSVVHCPQSHQYFGHSPFDWKRLLRAGVNITIGTDSLASIQKKGEKGLSIFSEMSSLASRKDAPSPLQILSWATKNGATALDRKSQIGRLASGFFADLIAIPFSGSPNRVYDAILSHKENVSFSMIGGKLIFQNENSQNSCS